MTSLLKKVPAQQLCFECKVIKEPGSHHCQTCKRCVSRYEQHCVWLDTCIGYKNHYKYLLFIFYVWLDVFLIGWISMASIPVAACEIEHCPYEKLCVYCNVKAIHYFVTFFDMVVCYLWMVPTTWMCCCQCVNFFKGKTTFERNSRKFHSASVADDEHEASVGLLEDRPGQAGRSQSNTCMWAFNCKRMCCPRKTTSQQDLLQQYQLEASLSSATSLTSA